MSPTHEHIIAASWRSARGLQGSALKLSCPWCSRYGKGSKKTTNKQYGDLSLAQNVMSAGAYEFSTSEVSLMAVLCTVEWRAVFFSFNKNQVFMQDQP